MSLLTSLTLTLGFALSKLILKTWLGEGASADLVGQALDFVKAQTQQGLVDRDKAQAVIRLAEQIIHQLRPLYDEARLPDDLRHTVATQLAVTLATSRLTSELLLDCRLDAAALARRLASQNPTATDGFSQAQTDLYNRLVLETSRAIVRVADRLEGFDAQATRLSFQDHDRILTLLTQMAAQPTDKERQFEATYRTAIAHRFDHVDHFGIRVADAARDKQSLTTAYITLTAKFMVADSGRDAQGRRHRLDRRLSHVFEEMPGQAGEKSEVSRVGRIDDMLAQSNRLIIQGDPGAGKTTLLQWIAVQAARRAFQPPLETWNDAAPFLIRLREWVKKPFPHVTDWAAAIKSPTLPPLPPDWALRLLNTGQAIVLIDGIDELPPDQRDEFLDSLDQLVAAHPWARYIISSRPAALKVDRWSAWQTWVNEHDFLVAKIEAMSSTQIDLFIDNWHTALAHSQSAEQDPTESERLGSDLKALLQRRPPLRKLADTPLLCAMLCALHREQGHNLPTERLTLYRDCLEMLLTKRDEKRGIRLDDSGLKDSQKYTLLSHLALYMLREGRSDLETSAGEAGQAGRAGLETTRVATFLAKRLEQWRLNDTVSVERVRGFFVERAGILREPVVGRIDFTHRTFQEYLAAYAAADESAIGEMVNHAHDDQWREVIILAAGLCNRNDRQSLLDGLIKMGDQAKRRRCPLHLIAVACLETCRDIDPELQHAIEDRARALVPPTDPDAAKLLARTGAPLIPFLAAQPHYGAQRAALCIDTLAQIGADEALDVIQTYATDTQYLVTQALGANWAAFNRREYARRVLKNVETLRLPVFTSWDGFDELTHLKSLDIRDTTHLTDLTPLKNLPALAHIGLGEASISEFFDGRVEVVFRNPSLLLPPDLSSLVHLPHLESLFVAGYPAMKDLIGLSALTPLTSLSLWVCTGVTELAPLQSLTALTDLDLRGCTGVTTNLSNLKVLAELPSLARLNIDPDVDLTPLGLRPEIKIN